MLRTLFCLVLSSLSFSAIAQNKTSFEPAREANLLMVNYSFNVPGADLAKRYGVHHTVGGQYAFKTINGWWLGAEMNMLFGRNIKELAHFENLQTNQGFLIESNGATIPFEVYQRGGVGHFQLGRIFKNTSRQSNGGLAFVLGLGYMHHKMFIDVSDREVPYFTDANKRGYDRLSVGPSVQQNLIYTFLSKEQNVNFYIGLVAQQAFTTNVRQWDFGTNTKMDERRIDLSFGIKLGWIIPLFEKTDEDFLFDD